MFCKNCGANLPDGTTFCGSCGAKQDVPASAPNPGTPAGGYNPTPSGGYNPQSLNLNNFAVGNVKGMRLLGVIIAAILLIFSITDYFYAGEGDNSAFNGFIVFEEYFSFEHMTGGQTVFWFLMIASNFVVLAGTIAYIALSFIGGPAAGSPVAVQKCILCGHTVTIAYIVGLISAFICPSNGVSMGYEIQGWFALIIAVINSIVVLPAIMKEAINNR